MKLEYPYSTKWKKGYIVTNPEGRKTVILYNSQKDRTSTSYARYIMSVHLGRFLTPSEHVDHIDEDKTNDDIDNLQLLTQTENSKKNGLHKRKDIVHGSLSGYRYCKCSKCRLGKSLYSAGKVQEYRKLIQES